MTRAVLILEDLPDTQVWLVALIQEVLPDAQPTLASTLGEARRLLLSQPWHFMLIDLGLPDGSGITLLQKARVQLPQVPAIVTTIYDDDNNLFQAMAAGAAGYLLKSQSKDMLVRQLQLLELGQPPISPCLARRLLAHFRHNPDETASDIHLSDRETEILTLIGQGLRTREVAQQLELTGYTVTTYLRNIYEKLNITSRAEAAREASRRKLIPR